MGSISSFGLFWWAVGLQKTAPQGFYTSCGGLLGVVGI